MRNVRILFFLKERGARSPSRETLTCALSCIHLHFERIRPRCHGNTKRFKGDRWISSEWSKWRVKETNEKRRRNVHGARKGIEFVVRCRNRHRETERERERERRKLSPTFSCADFHTLPHLTLSLCIPSSPSLSSSAPLLPLAEHFFSLRYSPATLSRGTLEGGTKDGGR